MSVWDQFDIEDIRDILNEGVWVEYGEFRIKIAYAGKSNKAYSKAVAVAFKPFQAILGSDRANPNKATLKKMEEAMMKVYARTIVKDWEGVTSRDGEELPFSSENCEMIFNALPLMYEDIKEAAESYTAFRMEAAEDNAKNS